MSVVLVFRFLGLRVSRCLVLGVRFPVSGFLVFWFLTSWPLVFDVVFFGVCVFLAFWFLDVYHSVFVSYLFLVSGFLVLGFWFSCF